MSTGTRAVSVLAAIVAAWLGTAAIAPPRITAQPGASPPPTETGGMDGFREFATRIERALVARDARFFIDDRARLTELTCTEGPEELIEPRCIGQPDGTVIDGIWRTWWQGEGYLLSPESVREDLGRFLRTSDRPTLYAVGDQSGRISAYFRLDSGFFAVIASSEALPGSLRILTFEFSRQRARWETAMVTEVGPLRNEEWLSDACTDCYALWERWRPTD